MPKRNSGAHVKYRKDRNCWEVIEFIKGKRKRYATGICSREDAERKLAEIIVNRKTIKQCKSIGEIIAYYVKEHVPTISRPDVALANLERAIPFWAPMELDDISKSKTQEYMKLRRKEYEQWQKSRYGEIKRNPLSNASIRRELEQVQAAINYAYQDNVINSNPFIWKPERAQNKTRWLSRSEAAALVIAARNSDQAKDYLPIFILIGIYTGARMTAILQLKWQDVDLHNGLIDFSVNDRSKKKKGAKTRIPKKLLRMLAYKKRYGIDGGYVIHRNQQPIQNPKKSFKSACKKAGITDVSIHTLRHTCASWLMQKNVSSSKIAKHLGHTSPRMIENTYGHLNPNHLNEVMEAFN